MRRWIPLSLVAVVVLAAVSAAVLSERSVQLQLGAALAARTVSVASMPEGWSEVGGLGVLVESQVPSALKCSTPSPQIYGPVVVAREYRSRSSNEFIQESLGSTPVKDKREVGALLEHRPRTCPRQVGTLIASRSPYVHAPFVIQFGWVGYEPLRPTEVPRVQPDDLAWSIGRTYGTGRFYSYYFLIHGVLLSVFAFGSARPGVVQGIVTKMAAAA